MDVLGQHIVFERFGGRDGLLEYLHLGIGCGRHIKAKRVQTLSCGSSAVTCDHLFHAWELHAGFRQIQFVIHQAIDHARELLLERRHLKAYHSATEHSGLEFDLSGCTDKPGAVCDIRAGKNQIGFDCCDRAHDG